jgi:hypothetical protein
VKKKIAVIGTALFVFASIEAFSIGMGFRGSFVYSKIGGGGILFSPNSNLHFGFNCYAGNDSVYAGFTGDYWLLDIPLTKVTSKGSLDFYVGPGLYIQLDFPEDCDFNWGVGFRLPLGLDLDFEMFDLFLEFAPQVGALFLPTPSLGGYWFTAAIGFRFWLGE